MGLDPRSEGGFVAETPIEQEHPCGRQHLYSEYVKIIETDLMSRVSKRWANAGRTILCFLGIGVSTVGQG